MPEDWLSPRLAVGHPGAYVYRSAAKRAAAAAIDAVGDLVLAPPRPAVAWDAVRSVAVLRLDHLGDLLHALPALRRLRRALPLAALDLWVGPWGRELAGLFADVDQVRVAQADWFQRPVRVAWPWGQIRGLARALRTLRYDAAFELRGDLRHHLALWHAGIPVRVGQAVTAGRFLLTHPARWRAGLHEQAQSLSLLDQSGVPAADQGRDPYLNLPAAARRQAATLAKSLKLGPSPILVQAASGTAAKRWTPRAWAGVLQGLPARVPVALLGSEGERGEMRAIASLVRRPVAVAAGRLNLSGLAALLATARLVLSVDSGPAHLAAVQGTPVLALFSGTNTTTRWAPQGARVRVLQAEGFPCSPCELSVCPYGNACMAALAPDQVLRAAQAMLRTGRGAKGNA